MAEPSNFVKRAACLFILGGLWRGGTGDKAGLFKFREADACYIFDMMCVCCVG